MLFYLFDSYKQKKEESPQINLQKGKIKLLRPLYIPG